MGLSLLSPQTPLHTHWALQTSLLESSLAAACRALFIGPCCGPAGASSAAPSGDAHFPRPKVFSISYPQLDRGGNSEHRNCLQVGSSVQLGLCTVSGCSFCVTLVPGRKPLRLTKSGSTHRLCSHVGCCAFIQDSFPSESQ